jgi:hypothetical protein
MFGDAHFDSHNFADRLMTRGPKEIACTAAASILVSPIVSILDKGILQQLSGSKPFLQAMAGATKEMVFQPKQFFGGLGFRLNAFIYFGTYAVANLSEMGLDERYIHDDAKDHQGWCLFGGKYWIVGVARFRLCAAVFDEYPKACHSYAHHWSFCGS